SRKVLSLRDEANGAGGPCPRRTVRGRDRSRAAPTGGGASRTRRDAAAPGLGRRHTARVGPARGKPRAEGTSVGGGPHAAAEAPVRRRAAGDEGPVARESPGSPVPPAGSPTLPEHTASSPHEVPFSRCGWRQRASVPTSGMQELWSAPQASLSGSNLPPHLPGAPRYESDRVHAPGSRVSAHHEDGRTRVRAAGRCGRGKAWPRCRESRVGHGWTGQQGGEPRPSAEGVRRRRHRRQGGPRLPPRARP
ncbi:MAG: hypothetical protein AVDCRST_MAG59-3883, partial [uncultured Thermomicrobiales bacterium]